MALLTSKTVHLEYRCLSVLRSCSNSYRVGASPICYRNLHTFSESRASGEANHFGVLGTNKLRNYRISSATYPLHHKRSRHFSSLTKDSVKMARITEKIKINYPRRKVWTVLSDFGNLEWQYNTIEGTEIISKEKEGVGMVRSIKIRGIDGQTVKEKLLSIDHDNFTFEISVDHGWILPFDHYTCKCEVTRIDTKSCTIAWTGEFQVLGMPEEEGAKLASGIYKQMFVDLPKYMAKQGY